MGAHTNAVNAEILDMAPKRTREVSLWVVWLENCGLCRERRHGAAIWPRRKAWRNRLCKKRKPPQPKERLREFCVAGQTLRLFKTSHQSFVSRSSHGICPMISLLLILHRIGQEATALPSRIVQSMRYSSPK